MLHKSIRVETRETEDEEAVKVLSAIFAFFPLIFYNAIDRHWSSLVGESYLITWNRGFGFCSSLLGFHILLHCFSFLPFFCGPSGQTDAVCTWQGKTSIFFVSGNSVVRIQSIISGEHTLSPSFPGKDSPLLPCTRGEKNGRQGEDSLEGGERKRLVGTSRMLKFRLGSALWSH